MASWREQIDEARRKKIPPPPKGVRNTQWFELSPRDWNPARILHELGASREPHGDHRSEKDDPKALAVEAQVQRAWDNAPTVPAPDDAPIRLTGYAVMLDAGDGLAKTILLAPYHGVGMDRHAPLANQMVIVTFKQGLPRNLAQTPVWIAGRMYALVTPTVHGRVACTMPDAVWQKFPHDRYPLPCYRPLG